MKSNSDKASQQQVRHTSFCSQGKLTQLFFGKQCYKAANYSKQLSNLSLGNVFS